MFQNIDNKFLQLSDYELTRYEGGGANFDVSINFHKAVNSVGKFFSGIYNAGVEFGRNWYNANN